MSAVPKNIAVRPDAVDILAEDHERIRSLFQSFEKSISAESVAAEPQLVDEICNELNLHTRLEEEIFYPAGRKSLHAHYLLDEAEFEHASMTEIIAQLRAFAFRDAAYNSKVLLLRDYVNYHFTKEEEKIFPKLRKANVDLVRVGDELIQRKQELLMDNGMDEP